MVSPSTIVGAVLALALSTLSSACAATKAPPTAAGCADEFYEGIATYPDGSVHQFCAPARADGIFLIFEDSFRCRIRSAGGTGYTREGAWEVGGDYQWLDTTGSKELNVGYQPSFDAPSELLPHGRERVCVSQRPMPIRRHSVRRRVGGVRRGAPYESMFARAIPGESCADGHCAALSRSRRDSGQPRRGRVFVSAVKGVRQRTSAAASTSLAASASRRVRPLYRLPPRHLRRRLAR